MKKRTVAYLILLLCFSLASGCNVYDTYQRISKQLPTFANMLNLARLMQEVVETRGEITPQEARAIMEELTQRDEWGNLFLFATISDPRFSFVLISPGRDGKLDFSDMHKYFLLEKEYIVGKYDRDIVFRDGEAVTIASAK